MNKKTREAINYSLTMEQGILALNQEFKPGKFVEIVYDFDCPEYEELRTKYKLEKIAKKGTDFERALRLLKYISRRLAHKGDYDDHVDCNSLALLDYSLNNSEHGINCLNKAKIFAEVCLAIGIKARRISILPYSPFDFDNHVVTEIFDRDKNKWIMMDSDTNSYFIDEKGVPLSMFEIRERFAANRFLTFKHSSEKYNSLVELRAKHLEENWYFCKNSFRFVVDSYQGFGIRNDNNIRMDFMPRGFSAKRWKIANLNYRIQGWEDRYPTFTEKAKADLEKAMTSEEPIVYDITTLYENVEY